MQPIEQYFPFEHIREKQKRALDFIVGAYERGYKNVIISAPTGTGKTGIGAAVCHWAPQNLPCATGTTCGGYYLTSQKMLQDQIEHDFCRMRCGTSASIKSATSYHCLSRPSRSCGVKTKVSCNHGNCPYRLAKTAWKIANLAVTNYAYFFTAGQYTDDIVPKQILVCDECHNLEREIIRHVDLKINEELFERWAPGIETVPQLHNLQEFTAWVKAVYLPEVQSRVTALVNIDDDSQAELLAEVSRHAEKVAQSLTLIEQDAHDWVFWREDGRDGKYSYIARPIEAKAFAQDLLLSRADLKVYMSAYPGDKAIFCRNLGLKVDDVAMASFASTFPVENRPIIAFSCGSMSLRNVEQSIPRLKATILKLFEIHGNEKGLIHCHSYRMMKIVRDALQGSKHLDRLIWHDGAGERDEAYHEHTSSSKPTVLISPSISEGFDFADNAARWQLIIKCPYPHLGDQQVLAKKDRDPEWYVQQAVSAIVQSCGRIVRSEQDWGKTYILDGDFKDLYARYDYLFPGWWKKALIWKNVKTKQQQQAII